MASDIAKPQQVILMTTRGKAVVMGKESVKDNVMTLAWHMPLSFDPPLYGISVGKNRFSHALLKDSKAFCINFIPYTMKDKALGCGTTSGINTDKFLEYGLGKDQCERIDCPRIADADGWLECEIIDEIDTGDHTLFVGQVLNETKNKDNARLLYIGDRQFATTR